jgi:hypothetical protein
LAAQKGWKVHQMDVKSVFLNGDLQEDVYMQQPSGFEIAGQKHKVCKLIKALYGLKQAPRALYTKMDEYLRKVGFHRSESDDTLYIHQQGSYLVILIMFVDDLLITGNNDDHIAQVKKELHVGFKMTIWDSFTTILALKYSNVHIIFLFRRVSMQQKFFNGLACRIVNPLLPLWNKT